MYLDTHGRDVQDLDRVLRAAPQSIVHRKHPRYGRQDTADCDALGVVDVPDAICPKTKSLTFHSEVKEAGNLLDSR